jgi:hypothetical protein
LALAIGEWNVPRMLAEMPASLFVWWLRFYELEPWGDQRADQRAAAQAMWNTAPYAASDTELPSLQFPYFENETDLTDRIAEIEKAKQQWLSQSPNSPSM